MSDEEAPLSAKEEEKVLEIIVRNQLEIKRLQEENDTLKLYYKQSPTAFPAGFIKKVGKFYVRVSSNTRIDDALAKALGTRTYERITRRVVDAKLAKANLNQSDLAQITKTFENKIEVGLN